jgi:hypothetical protein
MARLGFTLVVVAALAACGKSESEPRTDVPRPVAAPKVREPTAAPADPRIAVGMSAKEVLAAVGPPALELGGTEGESCFVFERLPLREVCFDITTEQATWKQVLQKNYAVREIKTHLSTASTLTIAPRELCRLAS